jgi:energy-coupling factor transport system ATP-binding protein
MQNSELQLYQQSVLAEVLHATSSTGRRDKHRDPRYWLEVFSLDGLDDRHPQSLSGGQKQRLVVACAAARMQDLLILDEPTSGLDGAQMKALAGMLEARRRHGASSLVITHDLELINTVCTHRLDLPLEQSTDTENEKARQHGPNHHAVTNRTKAR